jgi:uncharacterized protein
MLADRLKEDLKNSLKAGNSERTGILRLFISEVNNKQKEKFGAEVKVLPDEDVVAVLQKEAKKRREAIELYKKGGRMDLVKKEEAELVILAEYLPKALTHEEIEAVVQKLYASGFKEFNALMREAMKELKGKADGKMVGEIIKAKLQ